MQRHFFCALLTTLLAPVLFTLVPRLGVASNTQLYEKDAPLTESFTAKVRVVRDVSDDVEVFFESDKAKGAYTLPRGMANYGEAFAALKSSQTAQGAPVKVTADKENKTIKSVQLSEKPKPAAVQMDKALEEQMKKLFK